MRLDGRRESTNVEDRRGKGGVAAGGLGIGGMIIAGLIYLFSGGDISELLNSEEFASITGTEQKDTNYTPTAEEQELAKFTKQVLASTEDCWSKIFEEQGLGDYVAPTMVLCTGTLSTGCGNANTVETGPFYCSADQRLYINLSFLSSMKKEFGTAGDFAYAYVLAHEVGHHVQYITGTLHQSNPNYPKESENQTSVRCELQADYYAGVWGYHEDKIFHSLDAGDRDEAYAIAVQIGDDILQKRYAGKVDESQFTHGRAEQRQRWLKKGLECGDMSGGDTYKIPYSNL